MGNHTRHYWQGTPAAEECMYREYFRASGSRVRLRVKLPCKGSIMASGADIIHMEESQTRFMSCQLLVYH